MIAQLRAICTRLLINRDFNTDPLHLLLLVISNDCQKGSASGKTSKLNEPSVSYQIHQFKKQILHTTHTPWFTIFIIFIIGGGGIVVSIYF